MLGPPDKSREPLHTVTPWIASCSTSSSAPPPASRCRCSTSRDRKSVVSGKSVSVRVDLGGRRIIKKKKTTKNEERNRPLITMQHENTINVITDIQYKSTTEPTT